MQPHGGTRRFLILALDRLVDVLVLAVDTAQILLPVGGEIAEGLQPCARDQQRAQIAEEMREMPVAGGLGDGAVEIEVRRHRIVRRVDRRSHAIQRLAHRRKMRLAPALRGERRRVGLDADAQLQHRDHVLEQIEIDVVDAEGRRGFGLQHEGADALLGRDQAGGLEARDRLAHHGAADLELLVQLLLGRQAVAGLQLARADAVGQRLDQLRCQRFPLAQGRHGGSLPWMRWFPLASNQMYDN